jgi:hypothetical protein
MFGSAKSYDELGWDEVDPISLDDVRGDADLEYDALDPGIPAYRQ